MCCNTFAIPRLQAEIAIRRQRPDGHRAGECGSCPVVPGDKSPFGDKEGINLSQRGSCQSQHRRLVHVVVHCLECSWTARIRREAALTHRDGGGERHAKLKRALEILSHRLNPLQGAREIQRHLATILNR